MVFALLATSCGQQSEETLPPYEAAVPVAFSASLSGTTGEDWPVTRATGEINSSNLNSFGVFATYTGLHKYSESNVSPDFMYNEQVSLESGVWNYYPLRYWPNGEGEDASLPRYVSFFAYAPFYGRCISDFSQKTEKGDPWLTYRLADDISSQEDLLYAMQLDKSKQATNQNVRFDFQHALACAGDKVTISMSNEMASALGTTMRLILTDVSIDYKLTSKAKLVLWHNGTANWQPIMSENATVTRSITLLRGGDTKLTPDTPWTNEGNGVLYIPLTVGGNEQTAEVHISYDIYFNDIKLTELSKSGTISIRLSEYADAYRPGRQLDLNITLQNID